MSSFREGTQENHPHVGTIGHSKVESVGASQSTSQAMMGVRWQSPGSSGRHTL